MITKYKKDNLGITMFAVISFLVMDNFYTYFVGKSIILFIIGSACMFNRIHKCTRQIYVLKYALKQKFSKTEEEQRRYYLITEAEVHVGLLDFLDCFLRVAPQLTVQITYIFKNNGQLKDILSK